VQGGGESGRRAYWGVGALILRVGWSKAYRERGFHGGIAWLVGIDGEGSGKGSLARLAWLVRSSELR
jgi:hypothetical protein